MRYPIFLVIALLSAGAPAATEDAATLVQRALAAHGPIETPAITLLLEGTFDLATRLQGRTLDSEPTPIHERITIDFANDRLAYELRWHNYTHSVQHLRELYDAQGRVLFLDLRNRSGGWMPGAPVPDAAARYRRYLPQALLTEALERTATLAHRGTIGPPGMRTAQVTFDTRAGDTLALYIDADSHLLRGATAMIDMPLLGDTELMWVWLDHEREGAHVLPRRMQTWLGGAIMKDVALRYERAGADSFALPEGIDPGPAPDPHAAADSFVPPSKRPSKVEEVADGVYIVRSLRPGFHQMFVEFEEFVVAIDAPTGWYEMQQVPPMNWSHGDTSSALSEKYLRLIKQTVPEKPVRFVVLTHHHSDHIGGVRAFIAAGATVVAAQPAATMAQRAARSTFSIGMDPWSGREHERPRVEIVDGAHEISDGNTRLRLIELPPGNPKAEGFLVVHLPDHRLLYATAFLYPVPEEAFPPLESVELSTWFVDWLDSLDLEVDRHYNVHGLGRVEPWHLDRLRELARSAENPR